MDKIPAPLANRSTLPRVKPARPPLTRLIAVIMAAIAFGGSGLIGMIVYAGSEMNQSALTRQQELIENALDQAVVRVLSEAKSVALWDDGAAKVTPRAIDFEWLDVEYGAFLSEAYGHDEIYLIGPDNQPVYAFVGGARAATSTFSRRAMQVVPIVVEMRGGPLRGWHQRDQGFGMLIEGYSSLAGAKAARWGANILSVDGKPAIVAAITVVPTANLALAQPRPFILVSIVRIDALGLRAIGRSLLIPDLKFRRATTAAGLTGTARIAADDGAPATELAWTPRAPGDFLLNVVLPLVGAAIVSVALIAALLVRRLARAADRLTRQEAEARHQALHDPLSGLPNRRAFAAALAAARDDARHDPARPVAFLDIDRFKDINDTLGHRVGDELIRAIAAQLERALEPGDLLARFGGDEFAVLGGPGVRPDGLTQRLRQGLAMPHRLGGQVSRVTASVGIVTLGDGTDADMLMRQADIALHAAKDAGRDRSVRFSADMAAALDQRRELETDLRAAVRAAGGGGLRMVYQPILDCASGDFTGVEALARWTHPTLGVVPPITFIPVAEAAGLMPELGRWVLERAFADAARWPRLEVSINLSPAQLRHVELTEMLGELLARHRIEPQRIVLEITETVLLEASNHSRAALEAIRAMGFRTALDDFGTGYSSLSYLREYAFDKIKIDRSFVRGVDRARDAMTIVQAVVALGRGLGMTVVAEGVEDEAEASLMRFAGCDELQGYLFSRPVEVAAIDAMVTAAAGGGRLDRRRAGRPFAGDRRPRPPVVATVAA